MGCVISRARAGNIKCMDRPIDQPESPFEILRRLENIARVGTIAEVRTGRPARCRIRCGNITTNWIPWVTGRAAGEAGSVWWPPKVGEQCLMLAPGGDLMNAVVLPGAYSDANPRSAKTPNCSAWNSAARATWNTTPRPANSRCQRSQAFFCA